MSASGSVICFGEVLWDVLPDERKVGGAPLNVAFHLQQLNQAVSLISKVGEDKLGKELLAYIQNIGLNTSLIQTDVQYPTGIAEANMENPEAVTYNIVAPSAWDFIHEKASWSAQISKQDTLVFGSLSIRSSQSRDALLQLMSLVGRKVFDVNVRPPHYTLETVREFLHYADWVKVNEEELQLISEWFLGGLEGKEAVYALQKAFNLGCVSVTLGAEGAYLLFEDKWVEKPGIPVKVADTIGSGDGFLAALLNRLLMGYSPDESLAFACAMGATIATYSGATPILSEKEIMLMLNKLV